MCNDIIGDNEQNVILSNSSVVYEPIDIDIVVDQNKEKNNSNLLNTSDSANMDCEFDFTKNLILNWRETLNDSAASDIIIFVKDNKHIYAHRLVFHAQCPNVLLHTEPNNTESQRIKEKICWLERDQLSALAFLEFIYCGTISKYVTVFKHDNLLSQVNKLARLYKVTELFTYLRVKQNEFKSKIFEESESTNKNVNNEASVNSLFANSTATKKCNSSNVQKNASFEMQVRLTDVPI